MPERGNIFWNRLFVASNNDILKILDIKPLSYKESIKRAFRKNEQNAIVSSWKDLTVSGRLYWMSVFPFHSIIFNGLIRKLTKSNDVCSAMFPE